MQEATTTFTSASVVQNTMLSTVLQTTRNNLWTVSANNVSSQINISYTPLEGTVSTDFHVNTIEQNIIEKKFNELTQKWREETGGMSSISRRIANPNYLKILTLGKDVIPILIRELARKPDDWFALLEILIEEDENPITEEDANSFQRTRDAWISYGKRKRYL